MPLKERRQTVASASTGPVGTGLRRTTGGAQITHVVSGRTQRRARTPRGGHTRCIGDASPTSSASSCMSTSRSTSRWGIGYRDASWVVRRCERSGPVAGKAVRRGATRRGHSPPAGSQAASSGAGGDIAGGGGGQEQQRRESGAAAHDAFGTEARVEARQSGSDAVSAVHTTEIHQNKARQAPTVVARLVASAHAQVVGAAAECGGRGRTRAAARTGPRRTRTAGRFLGRAPARRLCGGHGGGDACRRRPGCAVAAAPPAGMAAAADAGLPRSPVGGRAWRPAASGCISRSPSRCRSYSVWPSQCRRSRAARWQACSRQSCTACKSSYGNSPVTSAPSDS